ncbi:hypothetical protein M422DRAFT_262700 [Sphaerobolus stellatus SS14]|uniref:Uncharacterized protein n=1 Tax=Sphaerobolus stellatus (strain SS14) TaxID=990650 RepID=A0A0C9V0I4_SPHS4|nr:hypothetical protein M422DRAFT_262700 [Sphaerobolus stellatus SS14]
MVPEEDFEDNLPMNWEQPQDLDVLMNKTHEFCQGYQTQGANDGHKEAPQPRFPIVEDISNEDEVIREPFPGLAGTSFGKKDAGNMDRFLRLKITQDHTAPSCGNVASLLKKIDELPSSTAWKCHTVTLHVEVIQELIGNPTLCEHLTYVPERLFSGEFKDDEITNEMWAAQWWWETQEKLPDRVTIVPVIVASDKTQLSQFSDYPEQCLVACNKENPCPICTISLKERGESVAAPAQGPEQPLRPVNVSISGKKSKCYQLPHTNIFQCFTPDLLHQLHKGVFKDHLVKWCVQAAGTYEATEVDRHFKAMPNFPGIHHFKKGISTISQWTGHEHKEMERVFTSLIYGAVPNQVSAVAHAVVEFIYYASFQSHSTDTLCHLQDALDTFHANKEIVVELGVQEHFRIPKIHIMEHYVDFIHYKGSADGYNTEASELLHIDFAKQGYRASNKKEYIEQMVQFLTRCEKMHWFKSFLHWTDAIEDDISEQETSPEEEVASEVVLENSHQDANVEAVIPDVNRQWSITKKAPKSNVSLQKLRDEHGTTDIVEAATTYLKKQVRPDLEVDPYNKDLVSIYNRISTNLPTLHHLSNTQFERDVVRATPIQQKTPHKKAEPARFNTVLVHYDPPAEDVGLEGYRAARVHAIFKLLPWFCCEEH